MGTYREFAPSPPLHALLACRWERELAPDDPAGSTLILPDGCVDLIWRDDKLTVAGLDRAARWSPVRSGSAIVGIRLRPGVAGGGVWVSARGTPGKTRPLRGALRHRGGTRPRPGRRAPARGGAV